MRGGQELGTYDDDAFTNYGPASGGGDSMGPPMGSSNGTYPDPTADPMAGQAAPTSTGGRRRRSRRTRRGKSRRGNIRRKTNMNKNRNAKKSRRRRH